LLRRKKVATVLSYVFEIQAQIKRDDQQVEQIQINDPIIIIEHLVQNSEYVAQDDNRHEDGTFPENHFRPQGFDNGKGPAAREAQQHQYLKNADIHCLTMIFLFKIKLRKDTLFFAIRYSPLIGQTETGAREGSYHRRFIASSPHRPISRETTTSKFTIVILIVNVKFVNN
jgi:hypothetical protein